MIFVGDDWAEDHHDVHLMNEAGDRLAARLLPEGLAGIRGFHEFVAGHIDDPGEVVVGIETDRGLWVNALAATGYQMYAINPLAVSRYRDRHNVAGAKSDAGDAKLLAEFGAHRPPQPPAPRGRHTGGRGDQGPGPRAPEPDLGPYPTRQRSA